MMASLRCAVCLVLLLPAGCRDDANKDADVSGAARDDAASTSEQRDGSGSGANPSEDVRASSTPAYQTALRFRELPSDAFPKVVAENGEPRNYSTILESLGSGCAAIDFDMDGWPDCAIAGGGDFDGKRCASKPISLIRNRGDAFVLCDDTGLANTRHYNHGLAAADFDHDGFPDLLLTGYGGIQLFHNLGDGTFESVDGAGLDCPSWSVSAAWGDFNHDSHLDLYVVTYVDWSFENDPPCYAADGTTRDNCSPKQFSPLPDFLFLSNGDGTFRDGTTEFQVRPDGKGLGVVAADIDQDGFIDAYVANDVMVNFLYRNDAGKTFIDLSKQCGACVSSRGTPDASMGVDVADFDMDGLPDLWAANFELENFAVYRNQGQMQFRHSSDITGVSAIGSRYVGWGSAFCDLDLDGDPDVAVCNGHVVKHPEHAPVLQRMILLENVDGDYFEEVAVQAGEGLSKPRNGRGLAVTDWNRDGRPDLLITPVNSEAALLENETDTDGRWLSVTLVGTQSCRHAIGAMAELVTTEHVLERQQKGGGSYASTSTPTLLFGHRAVTDAESLVIRWPSGIVQTIDSPATNAHLVIIEPGGENSDAARRPVDISPMSPKERRVTNAVTGRSGADLEDRGQ